MLVRVGRAAHSKGTALNRVTLLPMSVNCLPLFHLELLSRMFCSLSVRACTSSAKLIPEYTNCRSK